MGAEGPKVINHRLIDQNVAGTVLQLIGKISYLVAAIVIFFRWVAREQEAGDPEEVLGLR